MKPETLFRMRVRSDLKKLGIYFFAVQQKSMRGDADYCLCIAGRFVCLELKATSRSRIEKLQLHKLHCIERNGGVGIVSSPENWQATLTYLEYLKTNPQGDKPCHLKLPTKHLVNHTFGLD